MPIVGLESLACKEKIEGYLFFKNFLFYFIFYLFIFYFILLYNTVLVLKNFFKVSFFENRHIVANSRIQLANTTSSFLLLLAGRIDFISKKKLTDFFCFSF